MNMPPPETIQEMVQQLLSRYRADTLLLEALGWEQGNETPEHLAQTRARYEELRARVAAGDTDGLPPEVVQLLRERAPNPRDTAIPPLLHRNEP